jgi:hypothetical protein
VAHFTVTQATPLRWPFVYDAAFESALLSVAKTDSERQVKIMNTLPSGNVVNATRTIVARYDVPTVTDALIVYTELTGGAVDWTTTFANVGFAFTGVDIAVIPYPGATESTYRFYLHNMTHTADVAQWATSEETSAYAAQPPPPWYRRGLMSKHSLVSSTKSQRKA